MTLRVIGGDLGGRRLRSPTGRSTRPTAARVREAWFSALAPHLPGATILDLFAGSGALGIEALSRGAAWARFVESNGAAMKVLRANVVALDIEPRAQLVQGDVFRNVARPTSDGRIFDLALADPPYDTGLARRLVEVWLERPFAGMLCVEHARSELGPAEPDWTRAYGDTELSFFIGPGRTE
ncbi:MAG: 16S rRNA (guanine(966)-N(2))-methyltransferase RsmD [Gemmatimonadota bacterium]